MLTFFSFFNFNEKQTKNLKFLISFLHLLLLRVKKHSVRKENVKKGKNDTADKTHLNKIYENHPDETTLLSIIEQHSKYNKTKYFRDLPVFEMTCDHDFPMEQTIVPIMKRKVISYIFQIVSMNKINNFDSK